MRVQANGLSEVKLKFDGVYSPARIKRILFDYSVL